MKTQKGGREREEFRTGLFSSQIGTRKEKSSFQLLDELKAGNNLYS